MFSALHKACHLGICEAETGGQLSPVRLGDIFLQLKPEMKTDEVTLRLMSPPSPFLQPLPLEV